MPWLQAVVDALRNMIRKHRSMTIHDIGRLAAIAARYFNETPRFDYHSMRHEHAAGRAYRFGGFVLILADHSVGICSPPDLTANVGSGKAWRLRFFEGTELLAGDPEAFGTAYRKPVYSASSSGERMVTGFDIVTPGGIIFPEGELDERRAGFLSNISMRGFRLGKKTKAWLSIAESTIKPEAVWNSAWEREKRSARLAA